ncbi:MAG: YHYH domain-containing protein, partial [Yoonia sp.]|nr:YHYH domain-containing protein [Yoonia sp.]
MAIQTLSFISLILRPYVKQPISTDGWKIVLIATMLFTLGNQATAHSGGLNKQGCHADSKPYHCHRGPSAAPKASSGPTTINGSV